MGHGITSEMKTVHYTKPIKHYLKYTLFGLSELQVKALPEKQPTWINPHRVEFKVVFISFSTIIMFSLYVVSTQSSQRDVVKPSNSNENMKSVTLCSSILNGSLNSSAAQEAALAMTQYSVQMSSPLTSICLEDAASVETATLLTRLF